MTGGSFPYSCPREDCEEAYPHPLLLDYHLVQDHAESEQ
jgi:hypothetical protein